MNQEDSQFMKRFGAILLGLVVFTVGIIGFALYLHNQLVTSEDPIREELKLARIEPTAGVYAGETGRAAAAAAREAANAGKPAAFDGALDSTQIYNGVCAACHNAGAAGAPALVASAWTERLPQGIDTLVEHAINGIGLMPAKGGRTDLTDEQVRVAVEWMVEQVQ